MMDCQDVRKFIHAYLDGEFGEEDRVAFAVHVETCADCRRIVRFEERFKERLRESIDAAKTTAPTHLRRRIRVALGEASKSLPPEAPEPERERHPWRWAWRLVPVAAALAIIIGSVLPGGDSSQSVIEQSVQWHRARLPMDVGGKQEAIRRFFSDKVPFAVKLPRFKDSRVRLVGARLSNLHNHRAVYLTYQIGGQRLSVFIVDPHALPSGGRVLSAGHRRVRIHGIRGYNVAMFENGGTGYAVTSEMDRGRLVKLISY